MFFRAFGAAALILALGLPAMRADDQNSKNNAQEATLSDDIGDAMGKVKPVIDAKHWDEAARMIDELIPKAAPDSYDLAFLLRTKSLILIQSDHLGASLAPMEQALEIADRHHFNNDKEELDTLTILSQLYYSAATEGKKPKEEQLDDYRKAVTYMDRWFKLSPKPTVDNVLYYATLLFGEAITVDDKHPDPDLVQKSLEEANKGLVLSALPNPSFYILLLAIYQQQGNYEMGAKVLELVLELKPNNKAYWSDLVGYYEVLAQKSHDKDPVLERKYYIRAINATERAQKLGFLAEPRDNYNLFTFYYDIKEYGPAADLLYDGLMNDKIESKVENWLFLATCYQQIDQNFKAIEVLNQAAKRYPKDGEFYLQIAQIYLGMDKNQEAHDALETAVSVGGLDKPWNTYNTLAYIDYELQKFDDGKVAIDKAIELKGGEPDHQAIGLRTAIEQAIKDRDARAAAKAKRAAQESEAQ